MIEEEGNNNIDGDLENERRIVEPLSLWIVVGNTFYRWERRTRKSITRFLFQDLIRSNVFEKMLVRNAFIGIVQTVIFILIAAYYHTVSELVISSILAFITPIHTILNIILIGQMTDNVFDFAQKRDQILFIILYLTYLIFLTCIVILFWTLSISNKSPRQLSFFIIFTILGMMTLSFDINTYLTLHILFIILFYLIFSVYLLFALFSVLFLHSKSFYFTMTNILSQQLNEAYNEQLDESDIELEFKYRKHIFHTKKENEISDECPICLIEYREGDEILELNCNKYHLFHSNCIKNWVKISKICPLCKAQLS